MTDLDRIAPIHTPARVMLDSVLFCFTSFDLGRVWLELNCIYSCHLSAVTKLLTVFSSHVTLCLQSNVLVACPSNNWSFSLFEICKLPVEDAADWPWMAVSACVYCLQRFESHGDWEDSGKGMQAFTLISEKSRCRKILIKKKTTWASWLFEDNDGCFAQRCSAPCLSKNGAETWVGNRWQTALLLADRKLE